MGRVCYGPRCPVTNDYGLNITGNKVVLIMASCQDCHIWLLSRLSTISCCLLRLLYMIIGFLLLFCFLLRLLGGSTIMQTVLAKNHFAQTVVLEGSKMSRRVSAEAKYNGQSQLEAKLAD